MRTHHVILGALFIAAIVTLGVGQAFVERSPILEARGATVQAQGSVEAPVFEVDPLWPKPLPSHWVIGTALGVAVDARDHVFVVHRPDSISPGEALVLLLHASKAPLEMSAPSGLVPSNTTVLPDARTATAQTR